MADELTKALLLEEVAEPRAVAEALFASVMDNVPLVRALVDVRAVRPEILGRYLGRTDAPFLRHVVPVMELVDRLPEGLCARLLAVPVRRDAITGTIDVVVPDPADPHPAREIAFHLGAPVRAVRAPVAAIEEGLRRLTMRARAAEDDGLAYDSRPRSFAASPPEAAASATRRMATIPPAPEPSARPPPARASHPQRAPSYRPPAPGAPDVLLAALDGRSPRRPQRAPEAPARKTRETPPWGTPIHTVSRPTGSEPPRSGLGSEIPIPLTRRTFSAVSARGGTQRPPPPVPDRSPLGEGYALPVDPKNLRIVEVRDERAVVHERARAAPDASRIPGPPPLPSVAPQGTFAAFSPQMPVADLGGIMAAIRAAGSRDEVLELVLSAARMLAHRVALFVVKRGGYLGWASTPEFADRASLQRVLVPLDAKSVFDEAVREGLYLGPIRHDEVHAPLLSVMRTATKDVALVPIRVSGKTAVVIVADELGDTMIATRHLEEVARAAGESFARIVRMRR